MYIYYTLNEFTQFSRMIQKLKTDVWLWSFFQYYEQTALLRTTRKEEGLSKPTAWIDTELKDSYSPTSDYKFNTSTMFFHNPAFTFHHITRENIRPLHAGQTEHRRRPSLHETQSGLSGERLKDIEKRLAPAIVVRLSDIRALKFFTLRSQNTQKRSNHFSYIQAESSNTSNLG